MSTTLPGWKTLAEDPLVLQREYNFGKDATANTLAIRLPSGKLLLVSPPTGLPQSEIVALGKIGEVSALVAINGAHHLGIGPCREVFPNAVSYATPSARKRILKKSKQPGQLEPLDKLQPLLGERIVVAAADGCKIGDVLIRVQTEQGNLLYAGDFIANIPELPKQFIFKLVMKLTDSAPGLKVFRIFFKFFAKDPRKLRDYLIREIEAHPPAILVPGHGLVVARSELGPTLVSMLRAAV